MLRDKTLQTQEPEQKQSLLRLVDWHLVYITISAVSVSIASLCASYAAIEIARTEGLAAAYTATWLHLPLTYFASLFTIWLANQNPLIAWLSTSAAILNALLVMGGAA